MMLKVVILIVACVITVNCYVVYDQPEGNKWLEGSWKAQKQSWNENWDIHGKREVLDSTSQSDEDWRDNSSRDFEIKQAQKMFHNTDPQLAGNGRLVKTHPDPGSPSKGRFTYDDSMTGGLNKIDKDD